MDNTQVTNKMRNSLQLYIYNTLTGKKERLETLVEGKLGLYVCGPTVYGDSHLGHARPYITFDLLIRWIKYHEYKIRYVRNITDVGHLENDADSGEDKIAKKARLEQLEPMEVAQYYTDRFNENMLQLNILNPSIQPRATGHIIEQIQMIEQIIANGLAYEVNGSVYFDVLAYNAKFQYGELSGRVLDDLIAGAGNERRTLEGQDEKRHSFDFALWKKAQPEHIMRWPSPWGDGFPGWHIECSAMSTKYLGETFDIHGGGMDLLFPHHECEIAQNKASLGVTPARYWMHNNMITINGRKMGKSLGNFITLNEMFTGTHALLAQPFHPMTVRFFILQAHYRSTLDFSNEALIAAEKALQRLLNAYNSISKIKTSDKTDFPLHDIIQQAFDALNDDLNSPIMIAQLFELVRNINLLLENKQHILQNDLNTLKQFMHDAMFDILGLQELQSNDNKTLTSGLIDLIIEQRLKARAEKNWALSDRLRDQLLNLGIQLKDSKEGTTWSYA
jgi:cysteinyl-tRNA synthetase